MSVCALSLSLCICRWRQPRFFMSKTWDPTSSSFCAHIKSSGPCARGIWKRRFHSENASNVLRPCSPHYAGGISKRTFHSENTSAFFSPHYAGTITGHFGFVFENSVREITWLSWRHRFWKASFSKCFPSMETKSLRFQISPVRRAFSKCSVFGAFLYQPNKSVASRSNTGLN